MKGSAEDRGIHDGHRARMRAKCREHGSAIFDTYELLEMLLYYVIPYKDTNPVAKRLLMRFGSLDGVLSASVDELKEVSGIGDKAAEFLTRVGSLQDFLGSEPASALSSDFTDYHKAGRFFADKLGSLETHAVLCMFLDNNMRAISVEKLYDVDFESGAVRSAPIIDRALRTHASVVITAHNHPDGPLFISEGDNQTGQMLTEALSIVSVLHLEHFLVCGKYYVGALRNYSRSFSQFANISRFLEGKESSADGFSDTEVDDVH